MDKREIKFRIWDIETKQFFYWDITEQPPSCLIKEYIREKTQQFTSLKDKNSKEIYEGDILQLDGGAKPFNVEVIFSNGAFRAKCDWVKDNEYPELLYYTIFGGLEDGKLFKDCIVVKIIGNIYENPELLKGAFQ